MLEGFCVKCKDKKPVADAVEVVMKNGRKAVKGRCPTCSGGMFKILGGKSPPVGAESMVEAVEVVAGAGAVVGEAGISPSAEVAGMGADGGPVVG